MSQNSKIKREQYAKKQEEKGKNVIKWIMVCMLAACIGFAIWTCTQ